MPRFIAVTALFFGLTTLFYSESMAQSYNGYQTIGTNTVSFSLIWSGKPHVGFSYTYRDFGTSFTDIQTELRFPIEKGINGNDFNLIFGIYQPSQLKRNFVGTGIHFTWNHQTESSYRDRLSCVLTAIPSYVYASNVNDGLYGTTGLRISYAPILWSKKVEQGVAKHNLQVGMHIDSHHERTLGLSFNPKYNFYLGSSNKPFWDGDFYFGQTYFLKRS